MPEEYLKLKRVNNFPRLPLKGSMDITYRCNNNCRHCWLRIAPDREDKKNEISSEEIKKIVDAAKKMGCREWNISGGEPMLRNDFTEIFEYITNNSASYSINTNGSLINLKAAHLFKKRGTKMIPLYGATAAMHDHITRNPGSFEATMQGFAYLKEAGAGFIVQLIPMKDNYHQFKAMIRLAESLSRTWRIGAPWLYLSAYRDEGINEEIKRQRLNAKDVVQLDQPDLSYEELIEEEHSCCSVKEDSTLFSYCVTSGREFHIDPYGKMSFCCFIKEPDFRYDLRKGSFKKGWEEFMPSLPARIKGDEEYLNNCGSCQLRKDCRWCPVYGYLEHGIFSAKVEYLCEIARENKKFKDYWKKNHRRYYKVAGLTIQVDSDLPISDTTFQPKFKLFEVDGPGEDTIFIKHHFYLPDIDGKDLGQEVYRKEPWAIYKKENSWIYTGISSLAYDKPIHQLAIFNHDYSRGRIYNKIKKPFREGNLHSLTNFPTDQILLAQLLAYRKGCYLHSSGVILDGKGFLFVGHSNSGKSTIIKILGDKAEILCDDRVIIRRGSSGFRIYGTWSHGEISSISANSGPLKAILFLEKSGSNSLELLKDKKIIKDKLLACLIRPFVTAEWWEKMLLLIRDISNEIPCYMLRFTKDCNITDFLKQI